MWAKLLHRLDESSFDFELRPSGGISPGAIPRRPPVGSILLRSLEFRTRLPTAFRHRTALGMKKLTLFLLIRVYPPDRVERFGR